MHPGSLSTALLRLDFLRLAETPSGSSHLVVTAARRSALERAVYVGHPVSGIPMSRVLALQDEVTVRLGDALSGSGIVPVPLFPMRTTHLDARGTGASVYEPGAGLFSSTRAYTLQNRMDAVALCDAVLLAYDVPDDLGVLRVSRGIPFDVGWAVEAGKPVVAAIADANPNRHEAQRPVATLPTLVQAIGRIAGLLRTLPAPDPRPFVLAEIVSFSGGICLDALAILAGADARRYREGPRALIAVMPGGDANPNRHGQVEAVADWIVPDLGTAGEIVRRLAGGHA